MECLIGQLMKKIETLKETEDQILTKHMMTKHVIIVNKY